ncbi:3'(2'),5'-bisphosphate nucleotidase CysQ [Marinimicrococcus flavescens]|uniref:3'(2'),5'-bisphosphate nucleotidase CysQ n=1 Tax=Marinimicrococcus flavescens TaxID=3031815 RepID=A0AAP3XPJ2_9PROT|nr:3'(2'),5'-bisphosphate nucleotidase CysQ [Marinimicrococcus flavescens]
MLAPVLLLPRITAIAEEAGEILLKHYAGAVEVTTKSDSSPVTAADQEAEALILERLRLLTPGIPVVAEEEVAAGRMPSITESSFWLVDPLDGTREFISRNGEFTVNIGLIVDGLPLMGVVTAPARGIAWWGALGHGATRREGGEVRQIAARRRPAQGAVAVASRSHRDAATNAWLEEQGITETVSAGSSLKFCLLAEGQADVYPRFGPTMEWDTAAGHAVLRAAGGRVRTVDGAPFTYAKPDFRNPGFIAEGAEGA